VDALHALRPLTAAEKWGVYQSEKIREGARVIEAMEREATAQRQAREAEARRIKEKRVGEFTLLAVAARLLKIKKEDSQDVYVSRPKP
jgi:hypothetical protein